MKTFGLLAIFVTLACANAFYIQGNDESSDDMDTFMVTFNTDEDFIRIGEVEQNTEVAQYSEDETAEADALAENYKLHLRIKKKHLKKIEKAVRDHVKVSGSANINFSEPAVEPVPMELEVAPEDQLEEGSPALYRFKIKISKHKIKKVIHKIGKHVNVNGHVTINGQYANFVDVDVAIYPAEATYESHGKISMEGGASRGHGGRTEGHIGIKGEINF